MGQIRIYKADWSKSTKEIVGSTRTEGKAPPGLVDVDDDGVPNEVHGFDARIGWAAMFNFLEKTTADGRFQGYGLFQGDPVVDGAMFKRCFFVPMWTAMN